MFGEPPQTVDNFIERAAAAKLVWWECAGLTPLEVGRRSLVQRVQRSGTPFALRE